MTAFSGCIAILVFAQLLGMQLCRCWRWEKEKWQKVQNKNDHQ
jgi:hypothetical protein